MGRRAAEIVLSESEEAELKRWRRRRKTSTGLHFRAGIVLDCARGYSGEEIAERHGTSQQTVTKWRRRFVAGRLAGLSDAPRSGQPRHYNYFRTYDPSTGRYLESDPIGLRRALNTYSYVSSNPVVYADPYGLFEVRAHYIKTLGA